MAELQDWNVAAASNNSAAPDGWPEGMAPSAVNDTGRENMATVARWYQDTNFSVTSGGSANAYTMTALRVISAYAQGQVFAFEANHTNSGAATINVDGVGAKSIRKFHNELLVSGDIELGQFVIVAYDAGGDFFQMVSPPRTVSGDNLNLNKGADIASASPLVLGTDGTYFDVTGTTGFSAITVAADKLFILQFDGALTMTDGASLDLGGADITTAAGDRGIFYSTAANTVQLISWIDEGNPALTQAANNLVQVINTQDGAVATGTTTIPDDDTIPQSTEGDEYITATITPENTNNTLLIDVVANFASSSSGNNFFISALFQDSIAGALAAMLVVDIATDNSFQVVFRHKMTAGTTSATTFKLRAGSDTSGTTTFNGVGGARRLGGVMASSMTITEIAA